MARALQEIEDGRAELADMVGPERRTVALGFLRTLGITFVPQLVRSFSAANRNVLFSFIQSNSTALEDQLLSGELDLILNARPWNKPDFEWRLVAHQELVLIVSPSHPLARRRTVALKEIAKEPFVSFKEGRFRQLTEELCHAAGFSPMIRFESDDFEQRAGVRCSRIWRRHCVAGHGLVGRRRQSADHASVGASVDRRCLGEGSIPRDQHAFVS